MAITPLKAESRSTAAIGRTILLAAVLMSQLTLHGNEQATPLKTMNIVPLRTACPEPYAPVCQSHIICTNTNTLRPADPKSGTAGRLVHCVGTHDK